jgi:hypothetical protein
LVLPERLASDPFQAIALDRQPAIFLRNGESEPAPIPAVVPVQHGEQFIATAPCFLENAAERCRIQQAILR